jgi:ParB family chromosome partitioning protein
MAADAQWRRHVIEAHTLLHLDPRELEPDPDNVRREAPQDLDGLAGSIREHGLLQPIGVARRNGGYRVVYGNRRREAAILAGVPRVPCLLLDDSADGRLVWQLLENLQRRDLNDLDKAEGLARLRRRLAPEDGGGDERALDERAARAVGLAPATVRRYLGLLELALGVRTLIADGALGVTHAQHLRAVHDPLQQEDLARLAVERGLSAAALGRAARILANQPGMGVAQAVDQGERGVEPAPRREKAAEPARPAPPPRVKDEDEDDDLFPDDADDEDDPRERGPAGPSTADGHRRFRIKSVGAFVDEVDRLARALQDGDLARAADEEADAPIQLRLALRQLGYVTKELERLFRRNGWS